MSNDVFEALPAVDADAMIRLRARLAAQASEAELIDVAYRTVDSPVGKLLLAATDVGLVRVAFAVEGHDLVLERLADTVSLVCFITRAGWTLSLASWTSTLPVRVENSICAWISNSRKGFDAKCCVIFPRSNTATLQAIRWSQQRREARVRCVPSGPHAQRTRCRWWSRVTGWCAATAASGSTRVAPN